MTYHDWPSQKLGVAISGIGRAFIGDSPRISNVPVMRAAACSAAEDGPFLHIRVEQLRCRLFSGIDRKARFRAADGNSEAWHSQSTQCFGTKYPNAAAAIKVRISATASAKITGAPRGHSGLIGPLS